MDYTPPEILPHDSFDERRKLFKDVWEEPVPPIDSKRVIKTVRLEDSSAQRVAEAQSRAKQIMIACNKILQKCPKAQLNFKRTETRLIKFTSKPLIKTPDVTYSPSPLTSTTNIAKMNQLTLSIDQENKRIKKKVQSYFNPVFVPPPVGLEKDANKTKALKSVKPVLFLANYLRINRKQPLKKIKRKSKKRKSVKRFRKP